jgi:hypothetical protein
MIDLAEFKKELLQEANGKLHGVQKTASGDASITAILIKEAETRLYRIKEAALRKEAMAQWSNKELKNARANTKWTIPPKTERIKQIEGELVQAFEPYFRPLLRDIPNLKNQLSQGQNLDRALNAYFPGNEEVNISEEEEGSTLRMEFEFQRLVVPVVGDFAKAAENSVSLIDEAVPGFKDFVNAVNEHRVPLVPGYTANLQYGRPTEKQLRTFVESETERGVAGHAIPTSAGQIPLTKFWTQHANRMNKPDQGVPKATYQNSNDREFGPDAVFKITYPTYLLRAIQTKIYQGFRMDPRLLRQVIRKDIDQAITASRASESQDKGIRYETLRHAAKQQEAKIIEQYEKSISAPTQADIQREVLRLSPDGNWQPEQMNVQMANFGTDSQGQPMRGFRTNALKGKGLTKNSYCLDLNNKELQYLLYALQKHEPGEVQRAKLNTTTKNIPQKGGFIVPGYSMTYTSNGFDSDPSLVSPGMLAPQMMVLPPVISLPKHMGEGVTYNTDQGNLCRSVLVNTGNELVEKFFADPRVGEWATKALATLQEPNPEYTGRRQFGRQRTRQASGKNVQKLFDKARRGQDIGGAMDVWSKYIGTVGQRTEVEPNNPSTGRPRTQEELDLAQEELDRKYQRQNSLGNRTSAESFQENLLYDSATGQPRSKDELEQYLQMSYASEWNKAIVSKKAEQILNSGWLEHLRDGERIAAFFTNKVQDVNFSDKAESTELIRLIQSDPEGLQRLNSMRPGGESKEEKALLSTLKASGRKPQKAKSTGISDNLYQQLHQNGYAVSKMMDFLHALMVRACEERIVQKYDPDAAQKIIEQKNAKREAAGLKPLDMAAVPKEKRTADDEAHHLSFGRSYSSTTGKNDGGKITFGIKYAFTSPEGSNDPLLSELSSKHRRRPRAARPGRSAAEPGLYTAPEGAPDPAAGRVTQHPQQGIEREEVFQPERPHGIVRVMEDMTFWIGLKSSGSGFARTLRGKETKESFSVRLPNTYSYQDALAELERLYPQLKEDLAIIFVPISLNIEKLKQAMDKTMVKVKEELVQMGVDLDIAITDPMNRSRIVDSQDLGAAAVLEDIMAAGDETAANVQEQPMAAPPGAGYEQAPPQQPEEIVPAIQEVPPVEQPTPGQLAPQIPGLPEEQIPPGQPGIAFPPGQEEEEPNAMPKAMPTAPKEFPMSEPGYIGRRKKMKPLVRKGPDPMLAKLRHSSKENVLLSLANKLDKQGQTKLADKLDVLLQVLNEE